MRPLLLSALFALVPVVACAAPPPAIVEAVRVTVTEAATEGLSADEINDPSVVPEAMKTPPAKMFRKVDLNGDKLADWRVDYMEAPNGSYFCGSGGCRNDLYLGQPDGSYRLVFSHTAGALALSGPRSDRRLEIGFHGSICDSYGADECLRAYRWNAALDQYVEAPNSKGLSLLAGGSLPALFPPLKSAPPEVQALVGARQRDCEAVGGTYPESDASFYDIPDINGDGRRDWIVGSRYDSCSFEEETPEGSPGPRLIVLASKPDGGFGKALERADVSWEIDIAPSPARFVLVLPNDDCGMGGTACPRETQVWDAASGTLRPAS